MHASYEHDIDSFYKGQGAVLREQIIQEFGIEENDGVFSIETSPNRVGHAVFAFGQALTKIYDLSLLSRARFAASHARFVSTFYSDLKTLLFTIVEERKIQENYILPRIPNADNYTIDYLIESQSKESSVFLYGIPNQDKARLTTITLLHCQLHQVSFKSVIVFAGQQETPKIPRRDVDRLTNITGTTVASLEAKEDLHRTLLRLAA